MKGDDIAERLLDFAVRVLRLGQSLPKTAIGRHVGGQLLRCSTSAGSNYEEARGGESRADFTHKLGVSWKEARESWYWLRLVHRAELLKPSSVENLIQEAKELSSILASSLKTVRKKSSSAKQDPSQL
jgi:four helix bundle protein